MATSSSNAYVKRTIPSSSKDGYTQAVECIISSMQSQLESFDIQSSSWDMQCTYNSMVKCLDFMDDYDSIAIRENYLDKMAILVGFMQGLEFADTRNPFRKTVRIKAYQTLADFTALYRSFEEDADIAPKRAHHSQAQDVPSNDPWFVPETINK